MSVQSEETIEQEGQATTEQPAADAPTAQTTTSAPAQPATAPTAQTQQDATVGGGKNLVLPRDAFNARLRAATEKGKRAALAELDAKLQANGFSSFDEMLTAVKAKAQTSTQPDPAAKGGASDKRVAKDLEKERASREQERVGRMKAEKRVKQLEAELSAAQAERTIRESAILAGAKDVDYVVELLQRSVRGKQPAELKDFDESKFFESLKEKQPYLFGETVRPVTTGTGGNAPPAPAPGTVHRSSAANGQTDAKKMSKQELDAHLQKMGLRPISQIV